MEYVKQVYIVSAGEIIKEVAEKFIGYVTSNVCMA